MDVRRIVAEVEDHRRELLGTLVLLAGIGLVAIGISGVLALGLRATVGADYVAADPPGVTYTATRCADFLEYHPEARTCEAAAAAHHADEVADYRIAAGILGAALLGGRWLARRRGRHAAAEVSWLPSEFVPIVGLSLFGVAAAALAVQTLAASIGPAAGGAGQWLSAAVVSAVAAAIFAWMLLQQLRARVAIAGGAS